MQAGTFRSDASPAGAAKPRIAGAIWLPELGAEQRLGAVERGAIEAALFSAELVMEHQGELGLDGPQREALLKEIERGQAEMVRLQWDLQGEKEKLVRVLSSERVDEKESAASAARVMDRENKVKASHLAMLVRIKNHLTPAQQKKLRSLRGDASDARESADGGARDGG